MYDEKAIQLYRLAGLLHDIGHYPFSHAMEHGVQNFYPAEEYLETDGRVGPEEKMEEDTPPSFDHETLGRAVIENDPDIGRILKQHGVAKEDLKAVFSGENPDLLSNLVSSDLDCDRLDYLLRTAHAAGMPYGSVDIEYIVSQMCVDSERHLCLTKKASKSADHFLVSRYFDYTQLVFHKTVVGLEEVLKDVISELISNGVIDCSGKAMKERIINGSYSSFDDQHLIGIIREAISTLGAKDEIFKRKAISILNRSCPKLVASSDKIAKREELKAFRNNVSQLKKLIGPLAAKYKIPEGLWHLWKRSLNITKIGSHIPLGDTDKVFDEEKQQIVRILTTEPKDPKSKSKPLIEHDFALTKQLSDTGLFCIRLYVHIPLDAKSPKELRDAISKEIKDELPDSVFCD